ncbi:helix-turn-helix transcriptional regulator [Brevundimonas sp. NPDC046655]|jgi:transcriptional regulator with XRE-family HTH domain|uniref:helix-turn-helix transcriptional regulator n=1 Tax=unclassified Brevundimonas TaxID=2622653 RepID=UPI003850FC1A
MKPPDQSELESDSAVLSAAIRGLRRLRGFSSAEVAQGMNLALRTYQDFEAGRGRLNVDYIYRFCHFVDADPDAIFASLSIGSPDFAIRCRSNKLMSIVMIGVQQLNHQLGDRLAALEARTIVAAVNASVRDLVEKSAGGDEADWLKAGEEALRRARPKPGR